jgi:protein SCO1/2
MVSMKWGPVLPLALAILSGFGCAGKRYPVSGLVVAVDKTAGNMTVSHQEIPGYMAAMTMPFRVRERSELELLQPGMKVEFTLVVKKDESYVEQVRLEGGATVERDPNASAAAPEASSTTIVAVGQPVPDFELTDQQRRTVRLSDLAGKVVAVTFVYTRCPLPDYCPRLSTNFQRLQTRFRERIGRDFVLVSVTLDPQYDRPEVLAQYGRGFKADPEGWRFLTGSLEDIKKVCGLFGLDFWPEDNQITHNMRTAVIDRQGKLAANLRGADYTVQQLGDLVDQVLRGDNPGSGTP